MNSPVDILYREGIISTDQVNSEGIIVTDKLNGLTVYNVADGVNDPELQKVRGVIVDDETGKVVCKSFGFSPEVVADDMEGLNNLISPMLASDTVFFKAYEGTVFRVWCYKEQWYLSTHRKINAMSSKWGHNDNYWVLFNRALLSCCPAIKQAYEESNGMQDPLKLFLSSGPKTLASNKVYCFLLRSFHENRKVCKGEAEPTLYCIGAFDRDNNFAFSIENEETCLGLPEQIIDITDQNMLLQRAFDCDINECQGVICINPIQGSSCKIVSPTYHKYDLLRGNVPNVLHRYVQLRWQPEQLQEYINLYPEHKPKFDEWEKVMNHVVHNIMRKYIERYIHRNVAILPPEQYDVMVELHDMYIRQLKHSNERATVEHIWKILGAWPERDVNVLYTQYKKREAETGNGNRMPDNMRSGIMKTLKH